MAKSASSNTTHGTVITGSKVAIRDGEFVGRDKITTTITQNGKIDAALAPVSQAVAKLPPRQRAKATKKVKELNSEVCKGKGASDAIVAELVKDIGELAPEAASAVATAFGAGPLASMIGGLTRAALKQFSLA